MTRITGLATGLDVDSVVQETMQAYQTKIDTVDQQKKLAELQQELYREVITECRDFYDKYFDISKSDSILLQRNWSSVSFESSNSSVVTATASGGASVDSYDVKVVQLAQPAKYTISENDLNNLHGEITINAKALQDDGKTYKEEAITIDFSTIDTSGKTKAQIMNEKVNLINKKLENTNITAKYSDFSNGIVFTSAENGSEQGFSISYEVNEKVEDGSVTKVKLLSEKIQGEDCKAYLTNSQGETYLHKSSSNSVILDGVNFKFIGINASESDKNNNDVNNVTSLSDVKLTGKTNVTEIKDKIVKFINDYNTLMTRLNTLINEERDSDYMPLTDAQKEEMTEKQIELWEKKVKSGQLRRDSDLTRIRNTMKTAMSSLVGSSGNTLASFGINSVSDYSGNRNGTFTIDENALTEALENNTEDIMKIFISSGDTDSEKGMLQRLKSLFDKETQNSSGSLLKKAGMEGSSTASNNTLSKKIAKYEEKIERMESLFSTKQQALYTKYARLETLMNNLNSQQSYLTSMFSS